MGHRWGQPRYRWCRSIWRGRQRATRRQRTRRELRSSIRWASPQRKWRRRRVLSTSGSAWKEMRALGGESRKEKLGCYEDYDETLSGGGQGQSRVTVGWDGSNCYGRYHVRDTAGVGV